MRTLDRDLGEGFGSRPSISEVRNIMVAEETVAPALFDGGEDSAMAGRPQYDSED